MSTVDAEFEQHRPGLERLAYRMLSSLSDAEDVVQEAYLRWQRADRAAVKSARAYLYSVVTHLCIDQRRTVEARKESYVGPWLPEPLVEPAAADPADKMETVESVSLALLIVLESLSPVERAAYLLRRVFDYDYGEVAAILDKSEPNCRQLVSRAEEHIRQRRPRFDPVPGEAERLTGEFLQACASGDLAGLVKLLAADAVLYSDGGGKVAAARVPIRGAERIARFLLGVTKKAPADLAIRHVRVNGRPGVVVLAAGHVEQVITLEVADGQITTFFAVRNPDKLRRVTTN
jgi:RNA polymerase sigma-70 factor (ECF subfamily)